MRELLYISRAAAEFSPRFGFALNKIYKCLRLFAEFTMCRNHGQPRGAAPTKHTDVRIVYDAPQAMNFTPIKFEQAQ